MWHAGQTCRLSPVAKWGMRGYDRSLPSKAPHANGNGHCRIHSGTATAASLSGDLFALGVFDKSRRWVYGDVMTKKPMSVVEAGRRGARATLRRHGREKLRQWGKLGGRPRKKKPKK